MTAKFGPAGTSNSFKQNQTKQDLPDYLKRFNLDAYEYQCGHGVRISQKSAEEFGRLMSLFAVSVHSPYYISLSSTEEEKRLNSVKYILQTAKIAKAMGAKRIVVHSGSCGKQSREKALELSKHTLSMALKEMKNEHLDDCILCPETMGKINQLGTLEEVISLCKLDESLIPCVDFGHLNARSFGRIKSAADYKTILDKIENELGFDRLKNLHCHFSKIEYTKPGGEKRHLTFSDNYFGPEFTPLAEIIADRDLSFTIICESAGTQAEDASLMKQTYLNLLV